MSSRCREGCDFRNMVRKSKYGGHILLLVETPSGFAIFGYSERYFYKPNKLKNVWAKFGDLSHAKSEVVLWDFQTFKDKSSAIHPRTGVNKELAEMIQKYRFHPEMKLGVAKHEYRKIIQSSLGITCVINEVLMEVMWGIQNLLREFLPEEKLEVAKEDRLPMSQGLQRFLRRYGFDLEPDMVNQQIVQAASELHFGDTILENHLFGLAIVPLELNKISDINCEDWDALKLATALKVLAFPKEEIDFPEVFTQDELSKMKADAPKYEGIIPPAQICALMYREIISAHHRSIENKKLLRSLIKEAKKAPEAEPAELQQHGKVERRSARLNQNVAYQHVELDPPCKRRKKSTAHSLSSLNVTG